MMTKTLEGNASVEDSPLVWLLEEDIDNPGPRLFALKDLSVKPPGRRIIVDAQKAVMRHGPVPSILEKMNEDGYWIKPGPGYNPKYQSTVWSFILLAQLGADPADARVRKAGDYILDHARATNGAFTFTGAPSGAIYCLGGNLVTALLDLGFHGDPRLETAMEWLARATTGEGMAPISSKNAKLRYYKSSTSGPVFECAANNKLPCAWGGLKAMSAFSRIPGSSRSSLVNQAIEVGADFLLSRDPAQADYPMGWREKPNRSWWKLGYPIFYVSDFLQTLEVLSSLGYAHDPRLDNAYQLLLEKRNEQGRWCMEYSYNGKMLTSVEKKGEPSKWVTLRALRVLKGRNETTC
jgi:hypothetical protein